MRREPIQTLSGSYVDLVRDVYCIRYVLPTTYPEMEVCSVVDRAWELEPGVFGSLAEKKPGAGAAKICRSCTGS